MEIEMGQGMVKSSRALRVWGPGLRKKAQVTENIGSTGREQGCVGP